MLKHRLQFRCRMCLYSFPAGWVRTWYKIKVNLSIGLNWIWCLKQVGHSSLKWGQNVSWPRRMSPPGESR